MRDTAAAAGATAADVASLAVLTLQYCGPEAAVIPPVAILADVCRGSALTPDGCPQSSVGLFPCGASAECQRASTALPHEQRPCPGFPQRNCPCLHSIMMPRDAVAAACLGLA